MVDIARVRRKARAEKSGRVTSESRPPEAVPAASPSAETGSLPEPRAVSSETASAGPPAIEPVRPESPTGPIELPENRLSVSPDQIMARLLRGIPARRVSVGPSVEAAESGEALFVFPLAGEWYAVPLERVRYIWSVRWVMGTNHEGTAGVRERVEAFTRIPGAPPEIRGVMSLRGRMVVVYDTYRRLGLEAPDLGRLWVLVLQDGEDRVGLLIERRSYVHRVASEAIQPPPFPPAPGRSEYLRGIVHQGDRVVGVLDLDRFLAVSPGES